MNPKNKTMTEKIKESETGILGQKDRDGEVAIQRQTMRNGD